VSGRLLPAGLLLSLLLPARAGAQLSEVRIGAIGSYVAADAYRAGAGITLGYAPARIAYIGLRWVYHFGSTESRTDGTGTYDVTDRAQLFGADLGMEFPLGNMELVVGGTLGAVRFSQQTEPAPSDPSGAGTAIATSFVAAPMVMLHVRVGPVMIAPQVTWYFAGTPDLRWPVDDSGPAVSLSVIIPFETDRIRY
jgi:hypothetical protein